MKGYADRSIIDTKHSIERFALGRNLPNNYTSEGFKQDMTWVINCAIEKIINEYSDESRIYIVHSKSTKIGVVIDWRKDKYSSDDRNHAILITILPFKESPYPTRSNDRLLITETIELLIEQKYSDKLDECEFNRLAIDNFQIALLNNKYYDSNGEFLIIN